MTARISVGDKAPAFSVADDSGAQVSLRDFKGRPVVLYFYPKDDTSGCTTEACGFRDHWNAVQKAGAVVLGVSPDRIRAGRGRWSTTSSASGTPAAITRCRRKAANTEGQLGCG